jgi:hypothetical protein
MLSPHSGPQASRAEIAAQRAKLTEAQRLSQTGGFGWNISTGERYDPEFFRILGYDDPRSVTMDMV